VEYNFSNLKKTGTSIFSCPFKDGLIIATDTQATDVSTYTAYYTDRKTDSYNDVSPNTQIYISGAGYSNGTTTIASEVFLKMREFLQGYNIRLDQIKTPIEFMNFFNQYCATQWFKKMNYVQSEIAANSAFIFTLKNPSFILSFETSFEGGSCFYRGRKDQTYTSLCAIGSGSRYIMGCALVQDKKKPFEQRPFEEVKSWVVDTVKNAITRDMGSSTDKGLYLTVIHKNKPTESHTL
jgi:20S proteasome alpha/beta subunit